jgi:glycosyltransferase involved in cell wall biosynthesis
LKKMESIKELYSDAGHEPVVSVVMSVYNGERYLRQSMESILAQVYKNFEFIIIDDGSTDNTLSILRSYSDPRIRIYCQENMGLTKALNKAIRLSKGRYIARIDADEIALPERLKKQEDFLSLNPETGIVGSFSVDTDEVTRVTRNVTLPVVDEEIRKELPKKNVFVHGAVMFRKDIFAAAGAYDEVFKYVQDYELWGRIAKFCKLHNLPEVLLIRKITKNSISSNPEIMKQRALFSIKAQLRVIRNLRSPFYDYFFLSDPIFHFLVYKLRLVRHPLRSKWDLLKIRGS